MFAIPVTLSLITLAAGPPPAPTSDPEICAANPLTLTHPSWVKVPSTVVDLGGPPPAAASDPLMQSAKARPYSPETGGSSPSAVNPLTHRP